ALGARPEDLETLVLFGIDRACRTLGRAPVGIASDALAALREYTWPGNERELFDTLERAVGSARGPRPTLGGLSLGPSAAGMVGDRASGVSRASVPPVDAREADGETFDALERRILSSALERAGGNKSEAARALGLARTTFLDKLRKYGLRA